jgi:chromosome partitioning protein
MIVSIASQKGGTGKTSYIISLSAGLAYKGKRVLLVNMDSQANSSKVLLRNYQELSKNKKQTVYSTILERKPLVVHHTNIPGLDIVPSHILLSNTDIELTTAKDHREARLNSQLDTIKDKYDFIFIDNPPALGWLTINSFTASDKVLVVVSPGYFELDSLIQLDKVLKEAREYFNPYLNLLGYLFTMSDPTINTTTSLQLLRQTYTSKVLHTVIPRNVDLRDAHFNKTDIFSYSKNSKAAKAYYKLIREVFLDEPDASEHQRGRGANAAMKKRLNTEGIANELRGSSAFFPDYRRSPTHDEPEREQAVGNTAPDPVTPETAVSDQSAKPNTSNDAQKNGSGIMIPRHHDTAVSSHHDSTISRYHDTTTPQGADDIYEVVRKAVKQIGKEAATHRFTLDEKNQLADIEYTYKRRGIRTSENEITRIAINYFIEEYRQNGEEGILAKLLKSLNS